MTKKKILVVDDEAVYTLMLRRALTDEGFDVNTAIRGGDAISTGGRFQPDLLLCDWNLPDGVNGLIVTTTLRGALPGLRAVLMSGLVDTAMKQQAKAAGVFRILEKPVSLDELIAVVHDALG